MLTAENLPSYKRGKDAGEDKVCRYLVRNGMCRWWVKGGWRPRLSGGCRACVEVRVKLPGLVTLHMMRRQIASHRRVPGGGEKSQVAIWGHTGKQSGRLGCVWQLVCSDGPERHSIREMRRRCVVTIVSRIKRDAEQAPTWSPGSDRIPKLLICAKLVFRERTSQWTYLET